MDHDGAPRMSTPSPEETLALTRELLTRSRSRLREIDRRLSNEPGAPDTARRGNDAPP